MHKLRNTSSLVRFRIGSLLVLLMALSLPAIFGLIGYGIYKGEVKDFVFASIAIAVGLFLVILNFMVSKKAKCPLCTMPPLLTRRCMKHNDAKKLFGSYKLRTACSISFTRKFRCQYCGEDTVMKTRQRRKPPVW